MESKGGPSDEVGERKAKPAAFRPVAAGAADREILTGALERLRALQMRQLATGATGSHEELRRLLEEGRA